MGSIVLTNAHSPTVFMGLAPSSGSKAETTINDNAEGFFLWLDPKQTYNNISPCLRYRSGPCPCRRSLAFTDATSQWLHLPSRGVDQSATAFSFAMVWPQK